MKIRQLGFQEFDIISSVKPTTKYAVHLDNKNKVQYELEKACYLAKNGRPGPVWLDIPLDIQNSQIEIEKNKSFFYKNSNILNSNPTPKDKEINLVIKNLKNSKRNVLKQGLQKNLLQ